MIRLSIAAVLFISVFAMMQAISSSWREKMPTVPLRAERKEAPVKMSAKLEVQPPVPPVMPDLKQGYLFNEARFMESEAAKVLDEEGVWVNDLGIDASIEELTYSGSIIGDTFRRAIISYPEKKKKRSKSARSRGKRRGSGRETAQLTEGDVLNGYKVTSIFSDKIVFTKGEDVLEKFLYDPSKKRAALVRQAGASVRPVAPSASPAPTARAKAVTPRPAASRRVISRKSPARPDTSRVSRRRRSSGGPAISTPPMPHFGK